MREPIRVLNVTTVFRAAGIESFIMNMYRNIDRTKVQFDFMVMRNDKEFYDDEIKLLGGNKYTISVTGKNTLLRIWKESIELYKFLKTHSYDIMHVHYTTPLRAPYLLAAKCAGCKVRIYHSHSAEVSGKSKIKIMIYNFYRKKITKWATNYFACSMAAAKWIYERKIIDSGIVKVIHNGIDVKKFAFNEKERYEVRNDLKLDDNYVLIHTGRFLEQKNHAFVIDVFFELHKKNPKTKLLLLGTGDLIDIIEKKVSDLGIKDDVIFLGVKSDVNRYLNAADCYIMPSLYEGLPVAAIEAQCSDLPCILSTNITDEVKLIDKISFLSLDAGADVWSKEIEKYINEKRSNSVHMIKEGGYDVKSVASKLQEFYLSSLME